MSLEKTAPEPIQELLESVDGPFRFACHPSVPCFTECCRDLRLMLTPYDILRLKRHLGLKARAFLDAHTRSELDERRGLPMVFLAMQDNERKTCPFVSASGCQVYQDRPAACRIYPVARASRMLRTQGTVQESFYLLKEKHCRGFEEERSWTIEEWLQDQGLESYHEFNNLWMELITHPKFQAGALHAKQQQMFFMASYNLDMFREFVLGSRFLQLFDLPEDEVQAVGSDDEALLRLAFKWMRFSLTAEPTLHLKQAAH